MASHTLVDSGAGSTRRSSYSRAISSPSIGKAVEVSLVSGEVRRRSNARVLSATEDGATTWHYVEPTSLGEYETSSLPSLGRFDSWVGNPMFADLVFFVGTEKTSIPAHRVLLASSDSLFSELLHSENSDTLISALASSPASVFSFTDPSSSSSRPSPFRNSPSVETSPPAPAPARLSAIPTLSMTSTSASASSSSAFNSSEAPSPLASGPPSPSTTAKEHRRLLDSGVLPVVLEDVKPEIFLKLLAFLYCNKVTLYFDVVADYNVLLDLLDLSDRFRVPSLSRLLINFLETDANALKIIGPELISQLKTKIMPSHSSSNNSQPSSRKSSVSSTTSASSQTNTNKSTTNKDGSTSSHPSNVSGTLAMPSTSSLGSNSSSSIARTGHRRRSETVSSNRSDDESSGSLSYGGGIGGTGSIDGGYGGADDAEESFDESLDAIQYNLSSRSIQFSDTIKRRIAVAKLRIEEQARKMKADSEEIFWICAKNEILSARVHHTATTYGNALVIVGGHDGNSNGVESGVEFLIEPSDRPDSLVLAQTRKTGAGPRTLHSHATCRVGNRFYIYGGIVDGEKSAKLYTLAVINDETVHWSVPRLTGDLPPALTHHTLLRYDKLLVLFGGLVEGKEAQGEVWVMDTETNRWSRRASTITSGPQQGMVQSSSASSTNSTKSSATSLARFGHCALVIGSKMLVIGGQDHHGNYFNDTLMFDLETNVWTVFLNKKSVPRMSLHGAVRVGRHVLVYGGRRKSSGLIKELWKLMWDEASCEVFWSKLKSSASPVERYGHSVNRIGSKIYVVGGCNEKGKALSDLWEANTVHLPLEMGDARVIDHSELEISSLVGMGNFSQVRRGIWNNHLIAIKLIKGRTSDATTAAVNHGNANNGARAIVHNHHQKNKDKQRTIKDFKSEVELLSQLKHPNLVTFLGYCLEPNAIVMEYLPQNLHDYLIENRSKLESQQMIDFAYDIARGMEYLHRNSIIHRDLKSFNILLDENLNVKIADFGIARVKTNTSTMTTTGTIAWTAPEILRHEAYNEKSDVYSYAIVLWEILSEGEIPFDDEFQSPMEAGIAVATGQIRPRMPKDSDSNWVSLIERCWKEDPAARPSFTEIMDQIKKFE